MLVSGKANWPLGHLCVANNTPSHSHEEQLNTLTF